MIEAEELCLNCSKYEVCNEPRNWELCSECYTRCYGPYTKDSWSYLEVDRYKKKFFTKYLTYTEDNTKIVNKKHKQAIALWYSVRPEEGVKLKDWMKKIEKFISSRAIKQAFYNYEWKHDEETPRGLHTHMILKGNIKMITQHIRRQKEACFNNNSGQLVFIYEDKIIVDKYMYMTGKTLDENKNIEKLKDVAYREKLKIANMYFKECDPVALEKVVKNHTLSPCDWANKEPVEEIQKAIIAGNLVGNNICYFD